MKVKIPVYAIATASKYIGDVYIENPEDYEDAAEKLLEEKGTIISINVSNDFDIGDTFVDMDQINEWDYYKKETEKPDDKTRY